MTASKPSMPDAASVAGRDKVGDIRLNGGRGALIVLASHTRYQVSEWYETSRPGRYREQYAAALALFERESRGAVMAGLVLYHGGAPGLRFGDLVEPGHERKSHPGCKFCEARSRGEAHLGLDPLAARADMAYASTNRLYAKHYASLYGRGDLYRVVPVGALEASTEDSIDTFMAPAFMVAAIIDRVVLLTPTERRRLQREWAAADARWQARSVLLGLADGTGRRG